MADAALVLETILRLQEQGGPEATDTIRELLQINGLSMIDGCLVPADSPSESYLETHPPHPEQSGWGAWNG